jgi:hypothetical protein
LYKSNNWLGVFRKERPFLYLGLGASALCFVTWNFAVKELGAVKTSVYIYMVLGGSELWHEEKSDFAIFSLHFFSRRAIIAIENVFHWLHSKTPKLC